MEKNMAKFCDQCGRPLSGGEICNCRQMKQFSRQQMSQDMQYITPQEAAERQNNYNHIQPQMVQGNRTDIEISMKWYKFIIYFMLFANAAINFCNFIVVISGVKYQGYAKLIYGLYGGLRFVDVLFGLLYLMLAVFSIVVRQYLAKYKKIGPALLIIHNILNALLMLLYPNIIMRIIGDSSMYDMTDIMTSSATCVILAIGNYKYFSHRKQYFLN